MFHEAGMDRIAEKQFLITGFLEYLVNRHLAAMVKVITPTDPAQRGSQLSLVFSGDETERAHKKIEAQGIVVRILPTQHLQSFFIQEQDLHALCFGFSATSGVQT